MSATATGPFVPDVRIVPVHARIENPAILLFQARRRFRRGERNFCLARLRVGQETGLTSYALVRWLRTLDPRCDLNGGDALRLFRLFKEQGLHVRFSRANDSLTLAYDIFVDTV